MDVVVRGNRKFDTFTGQRNHPLLHGGVSVTRVRARMHVRIAGDEAGGRDLAANGQLDTLVSVQRRL